MKLRHSLGAVGLGLMLSACGVGNDANVGSDSNKHLNEDGGRATGNGGATSTGGATQSAGGASSSAGGKTQASGGATQGTGGATHASGGAAASGGATGSGGGAGGVKCGSKTCAAGDYCCNASCGICAPMGAACIQIACEPPPTPVDAGTCVDNVACVQGMVWSSTQCKCVPSSAGGTCTTAADCHVVADYCGACNCVALPTGQKDAPCTGEVVQCFADPCSSRSAACVAGQCVAQ